MIDHEGRKGTKYLYPSAGDRNAQTPRLNRRRRRFRFNASELGRRQIAKPQAVIEMRRASVGRWDPSGVQLIIRL